MNSEEVFRQFGKVHELDVGDQVYVIPPREPDEDMNTWAKRVVRVPGIAVSSDIDITEAITQAWTTLTNAIRQFIQEATTLINSLWKLIIELHDGDSNGFHRLTYQHLGHEAQCPVCETRSDAPQEDSEAPEGEGRREGEGG